MSEAAAADESREDTPESQGLEAGNNDVGGKRDADAPSGPDGSQQRQQAQQTIAPKSRQAQGNGQPKLQGQVQASEDGGGAGSGAGAGAGGGTGAEKFEDRSQIKRHVEASPQGRYLRFEDKLGTGQYKVVYRSYDTSMGIEVAWNTVNIKNLPKEEKKRIMNEVRLLQNLEHKNLVQFHGSWVNREREEVIFVTEIMQSGSLMDFIRKVEMIRWRVVKRWARQILRGIHYLHSQDPPIIHRDLKCDNIFINGAAGDIRIGDLGLSTSNTRSQKTMSVLGTPEFMAPELYEEIYNEKVDIYAFGMCMLEMVTKERPYSECVNAAQIYRKVTSQILPSALDRVQNTRAREFIRVCLSPDPDERPSAMDLQNHPFLKDKNEDEDNSLVMLDPPATGEAVPLLDAAASTGATAPPVDVPAKIDPTLPGVAHPAARGIPGLDTIAESVTSGGPGSNQGQTSVLQGQNPSTLSQGQQAGGASPALTFVAASQAQTSGPSSSSPGHSGTSNSASSETDGAAEGKQEYGRRTASVIPVLTNASSNDGEEAGKESASGVVGNADQYSERKSVDASEEESAAGTADGIDAVIMVEPEEAPYGAHKIPGNPPFESDDDEDGQEHDMSHPEGFLRAMPEDESGMRVLKLPDGRVQRVEDDDDEVSSALSSDEEDSEAPPQAAPSSAQAPPLAAPQLSTGVAPPPAGLAPAPPTQAPKPGIGGPAAFVGYGPSPIMEGTAFLSREDSGSLSSAIEGNSIVTIGSSTPGTVSPSGILALNNAGNQESMFPTVGTIEPALAQPGEKPTPVPVASFAGIDPGLVSPLVGPPIDLRRARSFSPVDRTVEALGVAAMPPITPAPPAPDAPPGLLQPKSNCRPPLEGMGTCNGPSQGIGGACEGERTSFWSNPGDPELQGLLLGSGCGGGLQTEIKIANLQGPEQDIMRLVMHTHVEGRLQEVEFDFNLDTEDPEQVSAEMISDLGLKDEELGHISLAISNLAETARRRRMRHLFSSNGGGIGAQLFDSSAGSKLFDAKCVSRLFDSHNASNQGAAGGETGVATEVHRGAQGSAGMYGSGGEDAGVLGGSEGADTDIAGGNVAGGVESEWSDDEVDIEEDDEFRKRKMQHDKKKRQAEKVYEARLAALLAARNDRTDEHKRAQERYKKDCDDFDKKVEKLQSEKDRRMEECLFELRGLEDGYRQKHRDAKQAKRHSATSGMPSVQGQMRVASQAPLEPAPKPQSYAQAVSHGLGQGQMHMYGSHSNDGAGQGFGDDGTEQQLTTLSQHKNGEDVLRGSSSIWSSNPHPQQDMSAVVASAVQPPQQGLNPSPEDEESRDRVSTL